jgi:hypothetical protein
MSWALCSLLRLPYAKDRIVVMSWALCSLLILPVICKEKNLPLAMSLEIDHIM